MIEDVPTPATGRPSVADQINVHHCVSPTMVQTASELLKSTSTEHLLHLARVDFISRLSQALLGKIVLTIPRSGFVAMFPREF